MLTNTALFSEPREQWLLGNLLLKWQEEKPRQNGQRAGKGPVPGSRGERLREAADHWENQGKGTGFRKSHQHLFLMSSSIPDSVSGLRALKKHWVGIWPHCCACFVALRTLVPGELAGQHTKRAAVVPAAGAGEGVRVQQWQPTSQAHGCSPSCWDTLQLRA